MFYSNVSYYCAFGDIHTLTCLTARNVDSFIFVGPPILTDVCHLAPIYTKYTGLFISRSGISELDCATTKTDTAERSISIGRESLQVFFFCTRGLGVLPGSTARW